LLVKSHDYIKLIMRTVTSSLALFAVLVLTNPATSAQGDSCRACNCQFNNIEALIQLMKVENRNLVVNDTDDLLTSTIRNVVATDTLCGKLINLMVHIILNQMYTYYI
jgi:hypothetical protein